jgi:flagellar motor switch protein FliG
MLAEPPASEGRYKSAVFLLSLGTEVAARVLSQMDDRNVEGLVAEMGRIGRVRADEQERIAVEFNERFETNASTVEGGPEYARQLLEVAVGPERAEKILGAASGEPEGPSLASVLESTSPTSLAALVSDEHPQLIALLAGQLTVEKAAEFLAALPGEIQGPVAARLIELQAPAPIALEHLERCLVEKLQGDSSAVAVETDAGPRRVADILGRMRRSMENLVLASLEQHSPVLAQKVNRFRFTIENLLDLEGRSLQRVLRDVEADTLRLAMKGLDEEQQQTIFSNMSERASARLREDLENSGPTQLREVEGAQQTILAIARALQATGEIQVQVTDEESGEGEPVV